jgi:molybdopterin-containing oxidoreductase family membrane subunit
MTTRNVTYPQTPFPSATNLTEHEKALLAPMIRWGWGMYMVVAALGAVIAFGAYAYFIQLRDGLAVTGMRDTVSWGLYITNFVFFIGISHVGALLSSILRLTGAKWRHPITRMAEAITFAALLMGAIMPFVDLGRPERALNLITHGRLQSPILWDIVSITTYLTGSTIFLLLPLIPDMALLRDKLSDAPRWRRWLYRILSFGWRGTPNQHARLELAMNTMAVLILPIAVMVHTVVSWIFAMTLRPGWNSTIFGPYFVAGALASGAASVVLAMAVFRKLYRLENFITVRHFKNMTALVLVLDLVYLYFNLSEYATTAYKMQLSEKGLLLELFTGPLAPLFWFTQVFGLIVPAFLLVLPAIKPVAGLRRVSILRPVPLAASAIAAAVVLVVPRTQPLAGFGLAALLPLIRLGALVIVGLFALSLLPILQARPITSAVIASALIVIQAWLKRYIIVVPVFEHPYLPVHDPTLSVALYRPTWVEWAITAGALAGFVLVYFLFSRLFPIVSVWETAEGGDGRRVTGDAAYPAERSASGDTRHTPLVTSQEA